MQAVTSNDAPPPAGPYSPGLVHGAFVFLAGQGPFNDRGERVGDDFESQVRQTFDNLQAVARAAGTDLSRAVRVGVYLNDISHFAAMNELAKEYLTEPYPARTTLRVDLNGFDIEIDAIVAMPESGPGARFVEE